MEKFSIKTAAIQPADCKIEKASLENTVTTIFAIKFKSRALLTALTPNNITGNNGTHTGNILMFHFTAYKLFDLLLHNFIPVCICSTLILP